MAPITVAVLGATGLVGGYLTKALTSARFYPKEVSRVVALVRDTKGEKAKALRDLGIKVVPAEPNVEVFEGIDVFINSTNVWTPQEWEHMNEYTKAAIDAGIKVFIPAEFGLDHYAHSLDNVALTNWKKKQSKFAEEYGNGHVKVVRIITGSFIPFGDLNFAKMLGFDHLGGHYEIVGDANSPVTFSHLEDVAASTVRFSILAAHDPASVPGVARISGDVKTIKEVAELVGKKVGKTMEITTISPADFNPAPGDFVAAIRLYWGTGNACYSEGACNELVNPGETLWKWTKVENWMKERPGNYPVGSA